MLDYCHPAPEEIKSLCVTTVPDCLLSLHLKAKKMKSQINHIVGPNKATKPFFTWQEAPSITDNWNMYEKDVK